MLVTRTLGTKADLQKLRAKVKNQGGTECKLLYRAGKYVITYSTDFFTEEDLVMTKFRKAKKKTKTEK